MQNLSSFFKYLRCVRFVSTVFIGLIFFDVSSCRLLKFTNLFSTHFFEFLNFWQFVLECIFGEKSLDNAIVRLSFEFMIVRVFGTF